VFKARMKFAKEGRARYISHLDLMHTMQRAMAELERNGLVKTHRTTGRMITEDITMLNDIRNELAGACVAEFFDGMKTIGFSPKEAADLLSRQAKALEEQDNKEEQEGETA